jgi:hypothetical protein
MASLLKFVSEEDIIGAVARAWTHPDTENQIFDEKIAIAAVREVWAVVSDDELQFAKDHGSIV